MHNKSRVFLTIGVVFITLLIGVFYAGQVHSQGLSLENRQEDTPPEVAFLSPKVVISALRCPWSGTLANLCGSSFKDKPEKPFITSGNRVIIQGNAQEFVGTEGVVVANDGRGQVYLQLMPLDDPSDECWCQRDTEKIPADANQGFTCQDGTPLMCAYRLNVQDKGGESPESGEFAGTFYLDANDPENAPSVEVIVRLREHRIGAYFYLLAGIASIFLLTLLFGKKEKNQENDIPAWKFWLGRTIMFVILVLSGIYTTYHLKPTYGTLTDHIATFLWAPTYSAAVTVIGKILERTEFKNLTSLIKF